MVPVRLQWTPAFEVGQKFGLDSLFINTVVPALPANDQSFQIRSYEPGDDHTWKELGDYFPFNVEKVVYYQEGPQNVPEIVISLRLVPGNPEFEEQAVEVLLGKYGWEKDE